MQYIDHMTNAQRDGVIAARDISRDTVIKLLEEAKKLHAAGTIALPHTNEQGLPVVHGCRVWCLNIRNNYLAAARSLLQNLPVAVQEDITQGYKDLLRA